MERAKMDEKDGTDVIGVGLLGLGTVGQGVYSILEDMGEDIERRADVRFDVRKVLVRNMEKRREVQVPSDRFTTDMDDVLGDPQVQMVVEVMGGVDPAFDHVSRAIRTHRPVVTANKHMLAEKGPELETIALEERVPFRFEASVGAIIPVVTALGGGVNALKVKEVSGILNGTCNHILSEMFDKDVGYDEALAEAQDMGLAEADPYLDVSGYDTAHKLCVLSRVVFGRFFPLAQVQVEGIDPGIGQMVQGAKHRGRRVRLVGYLCTEGLQEVEGPRAFVRPIEVDQTDCFYRVGGTNNIVKIGTYETGDIEIMGRGAGGLETATAVVSDMMALAVQMRERRR